MSNEIVLINKYELGEISMRLYDNLVKLNIEFAPLKFDNDSDFTFFHAHLERDSFVGDEKFNYSVTFYPNENLETLRLVAYLYNGPYKSSEVKKIIKKINHINESSIMGHLNISIDEDKEYNLTYRYGVSLKRNGDQMNHTELEDILFYLNYIVGQILDIVDCEENTWI